MIGLLAPLISGTVKTLCMSMLSEKLLKQVIDFARATCEEYKE